jgi:hypothetical protein
MTAGPTPPAATAPPGPAWLQPVVQLTTTLGVPTVIAGVLLYFVLFRMGATLEVIERGEDDRTRIAAAMQDTLLAALNRQADRFDKAIDRNIEMNRLLLAERIGREPPAHEHGAPP